MIGPGPYEKHKPPLHAFNRPQPPKAPERPPVVHIREGEQASALATFVVVTTALALAFALGCVTGAAVHDRLHPSQEQPNE